MQHLQPAKRNGSPSSGDRLLHRPDWIRVYLRHDTVGAGGDCLLHLRMYGPTRMHVAREAAFPMRLPWTKMKSLKKAPSYADKLCSARDGRVCPETENVKKSGAKAVCCDVQSNTDDSEDSTTFGHSSVSSDLSGPKL